MNRWLKILLIACISVSFSVNNLSAQESWVEIVEQLVSNADGNTSSLESLMEDLAEWKEHPISINSITKEELERFPFLSDQLIENILYYLHKYGPMLSEKELMMVEGMDKQTARCLKLFITFQEAEKEEDKFSWKNVFKYGKQELSTRVDIPLYVKEGYQPFTKEYIQENPNKRYLGCSYYNNVRYSCLSSARYSGKYLRSCFRFRQIRP